ncbi:MAG TPA: FapA family protein [Bacilli bacterium]|nr:FapA family protein [Bacilli bacterium]
MAVKQEELVWWVKNSSVTVEDGVYAYLTISDAVLQEQELPELGFESLSEYLRQHGVTNGIDLIACQQIVLNPRAFGGVKTKVASGQAPSNGQDAQIEVMIDSANEEAKTPTVLEDGRVDFFNIGIVRTVHKGQILARKTPTTVGLQGTGVNGSPIFPKPGRDVRLPIGKNTVVSEDGLLLLAETDGHVSYNPREQKVNVFDVFEVQGDVDFAVGNIDFLGNVLIRGSVLPGFKIVAAGDIEVAGNVDSAFLEAGGDIVIRGGVQMRSKGLIKSGGTVRARFLQAANVEAGVDVIIRDSIMHCHISAGRSVLLEAKKSVIVGGLVRAGEEVRTRTLGSPMATPTEVEVGVHPHLRVEMGQIHERLKALHANIEKTKKALALLDNMAGVGKQLPPDKEALRQSLSHTSKHLMQEEEDLMLRRSEIEATLLDTALAKVYVFEVIYPGLKITLGQHVSYIRDAYHGSVIYGIQDGEIKANSVSMV